MATTRLSSKGRATIPKPVRETRHWGPGQRFAVIETEEGILLKPTSLFPAPTVEETSGCLQYKGNAKDLADMDEAVARGAKETFHERE